MPTDQDGNKLEELPEISITLTADFVDGDEVRYEGHIDTRDKGDDAAAEMTVGISSEIQELLENHDDLAGVGVARDEQFRRPL